MRREWSGGYECDVRRGIRARRSWENIAGNGAQPAIHEQERYGCWKTDKVRESRPNCFLELAARQGGARGAADGRWPMTAKRPSRQGASTPKRRRVRLAALLFLLRLEVAHIAGTGLPGRSDKLFNPVPNADTPTIESTKVYQK